MSFKAILGDIIPRYIRLSKTEAKILDTIVTTKSGNAYGLWKTSGLKHYPTVLRTLKKLEEKRLVQVLSESGTRGERIYAQTLIGILVSHIFNNEKKKIVEMVAENSSLFREFYKIEKDDAWAFFVAQDIILDVYRKEEPRSFDKAIFDRVDGSLVDCIINPLDEDNVEWIMKLSKVKWIKQLAIERIKDEINRIKMNVKELRKLKGTLTSSNR